MHIPDGLLDPKISTGLIGAAAIVLSYCFSKVKEAVTGLVPATALAAAGRGMGNVVGGMRRVLTGDGKRTLYKMGMVASIIFAAQMLDFPVGHGTSGHLLGCIFAAVILGPFAGTIVMSVVLAVQALFLADGGLIALGANIVSMAVVGTFLAYYIYYLIKKIAPEWLAIMIAAWLSVVSAAFACAVELGFSGTIPLNTVVPAMVKVHAIVGIAEALATLVLVNVFRMAAKGEE